MTNPIPTLRRVTPMVAALCALLTLSCQRSERFHSMEGMEWNTIYHITYQGPESLQDSVRAVMKEVAASLSVFEPQSLVARANEAKEIEVDDNFRKVYYIARRIHDLTDGEYDPTVEPLVEAWGFSKGHRASSDTLRLDSLQQFVGMEKTHMKGRKLFFDDQRTRFNFSSVAKGFGCDQVGEMFQRNGVDDYMIEIGGEVKTAGLSPAGIPWKIAVEAPQAYVKRGGEPFTDVLELTGKALATSSNERNYHEDGEGGRRYGHTVSPKTGRPIQTDLLSATVLAPTCAEADAMATACMAVGSKVAEQALRTAGYAGLLALPDTVIRVNWPVQ